MIYSGLELDAALEPALKGAGLQVAEIRKRGKKTVITVYKSKQSDDACSAPPYAETLYQTKERRKE